MAECQRARSWTSRALLDLASSITAHHPEQHQAHAVHHRREQGFFVQVVRCPGLTADDVRPIHHHMRCRALRHFAARPALSPRICRRTTGRTREAASGHRVPHYPLHKCTRHCGDRCAPILSATMPKSISGGSTRSEVTLGGRRIPSRRSKPIRATQRQLAPLQAAVWPDSRARTVPPNLSELCQSTRPLRPVSALRRVARSPRCLRGGTTRRCSPRPSGAWRTSFCSRLAL